MTRLLSTLLCCLPMISIAGNAPALYGDPLPADAQTLPLADAIAQADEAGEYEGRVSGRITQVCRRKGCFVVLASEEQAARVTFADYAFFVPTDTQPGPAIVYGTLREVLLDSGQADHYADDAGVDYDSDSAPMRREWRLVADGIELHGTAAPHDPKPKESGDDR